VLPGIPLPPGVPALSSIKIIQPNLAYIAERRAEIRQNVAQIFGIQ